MKKHWLIFYMFSVISVILYLYKMYNNYSHFITIIIRKNKVKYVTRKGSKSICLFYFFIIKETYST
jgi:hypothetical protein